MSREQPNLALVLRQRNFEKLPVTLSYDDRRVRRFTLSRQFKHGAVCGSCEVSETAGCYHIAAQ